MGMLGFLWFVREGNVPAIGAFCFGSVMGWYAWLNVRRTEKPDMTEIVAFAGAIGGAALVKLFPDRLFGYYSIGLAAGFFLCLLAIGRGWLKPDT
jgi:hypothetical protein